MLCHLRYRPIYTREFNGALRSNNNVLNLWLQKISVLHHVLGYLVLRLVGALLLILTFSLQHISCHKALLVRILLFFSLVGKHSASFIVLVSIH